MIDIGQWRAAIGLWGSSRCNCVLRPGAGTSGQHYGMGSCQTLTIIAIAFSLLLLCGDVETNPGPTDNVKEVIKVLKDVLQRNYSTMYDAVKRCHHQFIISMYANELISGSGPITFERIMSDYITKLEGMESISQLQKHCGLLVMCLYRQESKCQHLAQKLAKQWNKELKKIFIDEEYKKKENVPETKISPLMLASCRGHLEVVEILLRQQVDPNIQEENGSTALIQASHSGHLLVVELLLEQQADPNIKQKNGWTALMVASQSGHIVVVEILLRQKANPNIQEKDGWTALMVASHNGHLVVVELLLKQQANLNIQKKDGWTALMLASSSGHSEVVKLLLRQRADPNTVTEAGTTALMFASKKGHLEVVEILLKQQANPNIQENDGWTALMLASQSGHLEVVELLLKEQANPNIQDNDGCTALIVASQNGHLQVVELLLKQRANPHIQRKDGWTALMMASRNGHLDIVKLLIKQQVDPNIQENYGCTALIIASQNGHLEVVELLLEQQADLNIQKENGRTALISASRYGHSEVVKLLLKQQADPNLQTKDGRNALTMAKANNHQEIADLLQSSMEDTTEMKLQQSTTDNDQLQHTKQHYNISQQQFNDESIETRAMNKTKCKLEITREISQTFITESLPTHEIFQNQDKLLLDKETELKLVQHQLENKEKEINDIQQQLQRELNDTQQRLENKEKELNAIRQQQQRELNDTQQRLENKEKELNAIQQQLQRELNDTQQRLENKEKELNAIRQQLQRELNDTRQELKANEIKLQRAQDVIHAQDQTLQTFKHNWVVNESEIELTDQVLGKGAYGNVSVAIFRGLRVAAKCLHNLIISEYNLTLFSREMDIASRVRHPNLVQFIGATEAGSPIILMELMRTSLYSELQKKPLTHPQIISISHDVALALNYLHQWKPNPIIHRDISSPNILLDPSIGDTYKAKVTDYGTANLQSNVMTYMPGNPAYASPEARDPEIQSPQMDVYSYSVVLMEMVLHRPPCITIREREEQSKTITSWPSMKSLIQRGISSDRTTRPNMSQILHLLKQL